MKVLQKIHPDPEDKGEVLSGNYCNGIVYINLEYIWGVTGSFKKFVRYFSKVYEHETLHRLIDEELGNLKRTQVAEEHVVRKITGEQLRRWQKRFYKRQDETNNPKPRKRKRTRRD